MAYFRLTNGFEKYEYMTIDEVKAHAQKFSQTFRKGGGIWKDHFEEMAKKTVLKKLLTKWAPKSIEMQQMAMFDQSVVNGTIENMDEATPNYADNATTNVEEVTEFEEVNEPATTSAEPKPEVEKEEPKKVVEEQPKVETPQPTTPNQEFEETDLDF